MGVDVGTTHVKAMLCEETGRVSQAQVPTPWSVHAGEEVMKPADLLGAVYQTLQRILEDLVPQPRIDAIGVTSMGEAGLFVRAGGEGFISGWQDLEVARPLFDELLQHYEAYALYERTAVTPAPKFGLLHMKRRKRDGEDGTWLSVADYLIWHWTGGQAVTHPSLGARTMAYHWQLRQWDEELLAWAEMTAASMPALVAGDGFAGEVTVSELPQLKGARLFHAGHDHVAAAFGADLADDEILDSTGTAEPLLVRTPRPRITPKTLEFQMMWGLSLFGDESFVGLVPTPAGGAVERWARETLGLTGLEAFEAHPAMARGVTFDAEGWPRGTAAWRNIGRSTSRQALYDAVLRGAAETVARRLPWAEAAMGRRCRRLKVAGGITQHRLWLAIRAKHLPRPQHLMRPHDAALVGAARLAAKGIGAEWPLAVQWVPYGDGE
ncbi:MAG: FGGY family carbohydrate kinase [Firmicutes bacterium]|nr:FGGY family carbohydrate kinase [Bacillota bacterium]